MIIWKKIESKMQFLFNLHKLKSLEIYIPSDIRITSKI